jgi:hypothetical protein
MKRFALILCAGLGLALSEGSASASWSQLHYSGYQPWYNIFAKRYKCLTPEEERLQKFWHDYYDALQHYYGALDHIDWVAYYKNHGYQINGGGCGPYGGGCGRINYAPVFVTPNMQWAVPAGSMGGPPVAGGSCAAPAGYPASAGMMAPQGMPQGYPGMGGQPQVAPASMPGGN